MIKWLLLALLLCIPCTCFSQELSKSFPNLTEIKIETSWDVRVLFNPKTSKVINQKYHATDPDMDNWKVIKTFIAGTDEYRVEFSEGLSDDPTFRIFKGEETEPIFDVFATGLVIPGNGFIYTSGHTNNMFDERKKYELRKGKFIEIKQPFYYVGLASKTKKKVTLHASKELKGTVATLPAGSSVLVLVNEGDLYLLRSDFGLVGWVKIEANNSEEVIEGLILAGD